MNHTEKENLGSPVMSKAKTNLAFTCTVHKNFKFVILRVYHCFFLA